MGTIVWGIVILAGLAGLAAAGAVLYRAYASGSSPSAIFFKSRPEPRLEVIEQAYVDGKRKLMLIRRDDVEHLIMTGGPVDVVVETGIGEKPLRSVPPAVPAATVFTRTPRPMASSSGIGDESDVLLKR